MTDATQATLRRLLTIQDVNQIQPTFVQDLQTAARELLTVAPAKDADAKAPASK